MPTTPTTASTKVPPGPKRETGDEQLAAVPNPGGGGGQSTGNGGSPLPRLALGLLVAAAVAAASAVVLALARERRWHRRWRTAPSPADRVLVTWDHTIEGLRRAGLDIPPSDTPHEVANHLGTALGVDDAWSPTDALDELATQATAAAYSGQIDAGDPTRCEELRAKLQHHAVTRLPLGRRLLWRFVPA